MPFREIMREKWCSAKLAILILGCAVACAAADAPAKARLQAGAAAVPITPFGQNPDWHGPITKSGVWGDEFTDTNHNGRWDEGEPFKNAQGRYAGIYLAGFGNNRIATGKHDDLWARALVLEAGGKRVAIVALDLLGYYENAGYYGVDQARKLIDPSLGIDEILVASTHNHEGPDTVGLWGATPLSDGKFPLYLEFVDRQIAKAITEAARALQPVRMKVGVTTPAQSSALRDMQTRTDGRPPRFFDEEMRVMQFVTEKEGKANVVATLINWNTHPESMEDENTILTSDFPGAVRDSIEKRYGGTAIYISGDLGAVEIVGDNGRSTRTTFDGNNFPFQKGDKAATFTFARTEAIGREVAKAVVEAVEHAEWNDSPEMDVRKAELRVPLDNLGYQYLMSKGILTKMSSTDGPSGPEMASTVYVIRLGNVQIITVPGELFPEVFYGVEKNRRRDCAKADTGRPAEPPVRDAMQAKYRFIFGLCPDELGYLVPGYDFRPPVFDAEKGPQETPDACAQNGVPPHYHETNSASSRLASTWACVAVKLLDGDAKSAACKQALRVGKTPERTCKFVHSGSNPPRWIEQNPLILNRLLCF